MQLRRLAADRCDADGVLEQAAGVRVVRFGRGQPPQRAAKGVVREKSTDRGTETAVRDLAGEKLEKAVELVDAAAGIDELEREIRGAAACPQPLLARNCIDPFDDPLLGQLSDSAHAKSLGPKADARVSRDGRRQAVSGRTL